jgi:hypothetical protein
MTDAVEELPDDTIIVRGGQNRAEDFAHGSGVSIGIDGKLNGVSVNAAPSVSILELTSANAETGYPGIPHNRVGVTTAGAIRAAGGKVISSPMKNYPYHATVSGLTSEQASSLFCPTVKNPRNVTG